MLHAVCKMCCSVRLRIRLGYSWDLGQGSKSIRGKAWVGAKFRSETCIISKLHILQTVQTEKSCASDILHQQMNALNTGETQHTSTWPVILWTLRDITTINFSLNIHGIYTYEPHNIQFSVK